MSTITTDLWPNNIPTYRLSMLKWMLFIGAFVTFAIGAPFMCHRFGLAGMVFLPMHFAILLAALVMGFRGGIITALVSPSLSYTISGMPFITSLMPMTVELVTYALVINLAIRTFKMPMILSLFITMLAGRGVSIVLVSFILQNSPLPIQLHNIFITALPGILIQLAFVPLVSSKIMNFLKDK